MEALRKDTMEKENRFETVYEESGLFTGTRMILVDKETGVHYLFVQQGNAGGLIPLLDAEGNPVVAR